MAAATHAATDIPTIGPNAAAADIPTIGGTTTDAASTGATTTCTTWLAAARGIKHHPWSSPRFSTDGKFHGPDDDKHDDEYDGKHEQLIF